MTRVALPPRLLPQENVPVVVAARRTPIGSAGHALAGLDAAGLLAPVLAATLADVRALAGALGDAPSGDATDVADLAPDDVVIGNCLGPGGNPARVATLAAGLGLGVPAVTVDRQCGSGQEAIHQAATLVAAGRARLVLAGGVESASTAPHRAFRAADPGGEPTPYERAPFAPRDVGDPEMGPAADDLARVSGVSRERQDAYAARSHRRTLAAASRGAFADEIVPVGGVDADERPRPLSPAVLARLRPAFVPGGTVTAGNACGISDAAAVVAVVPESLRATWGVPGLALRAWASVGVDPNLPGIGPVPAVHAVLEEAGVALDDVEVFEMTEAFAAQVLACTDALGLDPLGADAERFCPQGGAIALGHPWGASGALLVVRLFAELVRGDASGAPAGTPEKRPRYGVATCAIGGGQGVALLAERVGP